MNVKAKVEKPFNGFKEGEEIVLLKTTADHLASLTPKWVTVLGVTKEPKTVAPAKKMKPTKKQKELSGDSHA